jgi:hypothetical protein
MSNRSSDMRGNRTGWKDDTSHKTPQTAVHRHTQDQTQYRRPTVKEHGPHWDSQQDFNELKIFVLILTNQFELF